MEKMIIEEKESNQRKLLLTDLNLDILTLITSFLQPQALARLEQTCNLLNQFIKVYGWKSILDQSLVKISYSFPPSNISAKEIVRIDHAWNSQSFIASQCGLGGSIQKGSLGSVGRLQDRDRKTPFSVPFCQLHLLPHGLILLMQSEMHYWSKIELERLEPITMKSSQTFLLENPANLDKDWIESHNRSKNKNKIQNTKISFHVSPIWDICASAILNEQGTLIALARVNGLIEIISLNPIGRSKEEQPQNLSIKVRLIWFWTDLMNKNVKIQTLSACPNSGLLTICSKQGDIWLISCKQQRRYQFIAGKKRFNNQLRVKAISHWNVNCAIWSACFGVAKVKNKNRLNPAWLAIGTGSEKGIMIYSLNYKEGTLLQQPKESVCIPCKGIAVYSIKSLVAQVNKTNQEYLFAGCFDGRLRTFNIDKILEGNSIIPSNEVYDKFDPSAIYSLSIIGKGMNEVRIAAGTSHHGMVKIFCFTENYFLQDYKENDEILSNSNSSIEDQNWSMFTANPSHSPIYSLTGSFDRLFGVTDQKLWQIDLRKGAKREYLSNNKNNNNKENELYMGRLAFYRHKDMILENSTLPSWIDQIETKT